MLVSERTYLTCREEIIDRLLEEEIDINNLDLNVEDGKEKVTEENIEQSKKRT